MYVSAFTIGMGYFIGGLIPLLPYFFIPRAQVALIYSCIVTGIVLLVFGAVKARVTGASQSPAGYVWGAFSTLMVGGIAAAAAFAIVRALEGGAD
jgi:VIT1/CCC1 family predicted Fe2+/Mn2+ transporter